MNDKPQALKLTKYQQTLVRLALGSEIRGLQSAKHPSFDKQAAELSRVLELFRNGDIAISNSFNNDIPTLDEESIDPFDALRNEQLLREEGI